MKWIRSVRSNAWVLGVLLCGVTSPLYAQNRILMIDAYGGIVANNSWKSDSDWIWSPDGNPVVETTLLLKSNETVVSFEAETPKVQFEVLEGGRGIRFRSFHRSHLFKVVKRTSDGTEQVESLSVSIAPSSGPLAVHESCAPLGLTFSVQDPASLPFFGVRCEPQKDADTRRIHVFSDPQWRIADAGGVSKSERVERPGHSRFDWKLVESKVEGAALETFFDMASNDRALQKVRVQVRYEKNAHKRWGAEVYLGSTFFYFRESAIDLKMSGLNLTLKAGGRYEILPQKLDVGLNSFASVAPVFRTENVSPPWFLGINGRVGYLLPVEWSGVRFKISLGYYYWASLVKDTAYGLPGVWGPQALVNVFRTARGTRAFHSYLKYAPLRNDTSFVSAENFEFAVGGGLQVNAVGSRFPILVGLDLAYIRVSSELSLNRVSLMSTSLGVSVTF